MKRILLMGCVLCLAGSHGWASESTVDGHKRTGDQTLLTNQTPPVKKLKTEKGSPSTIISDSKNSEGIEEDTSRREDSALEEAAEDLRQEMLEDEIYKAHCDMVREVSRGLKPYLNSEKEIDGTLWTIIEIAAENYQKQIEVIENKLNEKPDLRPLITQEDRIYAARSEVFYHILGKMSDIIWDEEGGRRGIRAQAIKKALKSFSSKQSKISDGFKKIEE